MGEGHRHSGAFECQSVVLALSGCQTFPYHDPYDAMGRSTQGHFNAAQKDYLGWWGLSTIAVLQPGQAGTYTIAPLENFGSGTLALKVPAAVDVDGTHGWHYYIEHRQRRGFDSNLPLPDAALNGGLIRLRSGEPLPDHTRLLDTTPDSVRVSSEGTPTLSVHDINNAFDAEDSVLPVGQTFTDPSGLRITAVSAASNGLTVQVSAPYPLEVTQLSVPVTTPLTDIFFQDAAGNIGIGTTNPGLLLHVHGQADDFLRLTRQGQGQAWDLGVGGSLTPGTFFIARSGVSRDFNLAPNGYVGIGAMEPRIKLHLRSEADDMFRLERANQPQTWEVGVGQSLAPGTFFIARSGISRDLNISTSGNVAIGTIDPGTYKLYVNGPAYATGGWGGSSLALKTNLQRLTPTEEEALLAKVRDLALYRYQLKQPDGLKATHLGLIAEEAPEELVDTRRTAMSYGDTIAVLMATLKAQQSRIERLEAQLQALEAQRESSAR